MGLTFFSYTSISVHPLSLCLLSYIFGIALQYSHIGFLQASLIYIFLYILLLFIAYLKTSIGRQYFIISGIILISSLFGYYRHFSVVDNFYSKQQDLINKKIEFTGQIINYEMSADKKKNHVLTLKTLSPVTTIIKIYLRLSAKVSVGDYISTQLFIKNNRENSAFKNYLVKENIAASIFVQQLDYKILARPTFNIIGLFSKIRNRIYNATRSKMSTLTHGLFCSIFLGTKPANAQKLEIIYEKFSHWGIVHYLARSGLHVAIIIFAWGLLLRFIYCNFIIKHIFLLLLMSSYYILTWPNISFVRSFFVFGLYKICLFKKLPIQAFYILSLATLLILINNPLQLFFLDFQLSFGLTFALIWFNKVRKKINKLQNKTIE